MKLISFISIALLNIFTAYSLPPKPWLYIEGKYLKNWEGKPFILGAIGTIWQGELYASENPPTIPIVGVEISKPALKSLKEGDIWKGNVAELIRDVPEIRIRKLRGASKGKVVFFKKEVRQWSFFSIPLPYFLTAGDYEISARYFSPKEGSASTGVYLYQPPEHIPLNFSLPDPKDDEFHIYTQRFTVSREAMEIIFKKTDTSYKEGIPLDWIEIRAISSKKQKKFQPIKVEVREELFSGNKLFEVVEKEGIKAVSLKSEAGLFTFFSFPLSPPLDMGEYEMKITYLGDPERRGSLTIYTDEKGEHREIIGIPHKLDGRVHILKTKFIVNKSCQAIVFKKTGGVPYERRIWKDDFESLLKYFKQNGLNAVRIAVSAFFDELGDKKLKEMGGFSGFIRKTIDPLVEACKKNQLYAIIDLHTYPQSNPEREPMKILYEWYIPFWRAVASIYKDEGWVAGYELWNEPGGVGCNDLRKWYKDCIREIRKVDRRHIIIVSDASAGWGGTELTWGDTNFDVGDPERQVVFTLHGGVGPSGLKDVDFLCYIMDKWQVPIMLGEWECDGEWGSNEEEKAKGREIFREILNKLSQCRNKHAHSFMIWRAHKPPAYIELWAPFARKYCGALESRVK